MTDYGQGRPTQRRTPIVAVPTLLAAVAVCLTLFAAGWIVGEHGHHWAGIIALFAGLLASLVLSRSLSARVQRLRSELSGVDFSTGGWTAPAGELLQLGAEIRGMKQEHEAAVEAARNRLRLLYLAVDAMREGVVAVDGSLRILFVNRGAGEIFDSTTSFRDVVGRQLIDIIRLPLLHELIDLVLSGEEAAHGECETGDPLRVFRVTVVPARLDAGERGAVATFADETTLHTLKRVRQDFVANVSHELRTPIAGVQGWSETLLSGVLPLNPEAREPVERIHEGALRLAELTEDLLTLSRLDFQGADAELEAIEIRAVVDSVYHSLRERAEAAGVTLKAELSPIHPTVWGTHRSWEYILRNLVDNAIKYGGTSGTVTIRTREVGDRVRVEVRDTGPGIERQHVKRVFERFYRVDEGRGRMAGGSGLGLSIVRNYAAAIGGITGVDSTPGQGSTFWIDLPPVQGRSVEDSDSEHSADLRDAE